ncbi:Fe2+-dependent dioxygenase [Pseudohongiella sp.]|uniref:Fe2+-dependent dioxygenase n=1 Tax=Pseudohongiella sp. TaxID=1979412 RepID=UPI0017E63CC3|nr:Fe2+-dependent dioxygenase [Pseudohongiella sp.]HDZ07702.1 Fe2+-dependent dioxygenase [Pseudohongiella sp.]HEA63282.1 Fe2+-dependent dioxygenase [Pseudohongiella sp.]
MILPVAGVLSPALITTCQQLASDDTLFVDGRSTAGWYAKQHKHNLQARAAEPVQKALEQVMAAITGHELIQAAARPKRIIRMLLSRYDEGMHYGHHVDDALIDGHRTDLSFTLFLNEPGAYDGGELVIDEPSAERPFKLAAGSMLLYPSNTLHRVMPVTRGQRLVLAGWIRSLIREPAQRELLFDLERSIAQLRSAAGQGEALALLLKTRSNLLRMWAED